SKKDGKPKEKAVIPDSTLAPEVQDFCRLIFDTSIIDATLSSMNYDANKLPLGMAVHSSHQMLKLTARNRQVGQVDHPQRIRGSQSRHPDPISCGDTPLMS
ncbi:hypothetical protein V5O48_019694, partial [Marasmius crinis-equi]